MMRTVLEVEIDRPIDEVFDYTLNNAVEWSHTVIESDMIEETPEYIGSRFRVVTEDKGHRMEFDGVVVSHDPPFESVIFLRGAMFDIHCAYLFDDLGRSTRVTQHCRVCGKGIMRPFLILMGLLTKRSGRKALEIELQNLKRILESR